MDKLPTEIKQLGKQAMLRYLKALRSGGYVNNLIRCMFVGHFGVGKTTLVRSLLKKDKRKVRSTDGIEVHIRKCFFNKDNNEWHVQGKYKLIVLFKGQGSHYKII